MTTLAEAQTILANYLAAEAAVLEGKEIRLSITDGGKDRMWRSEDLVEIRKGRQEWQGIVSRLTAAQAGRPTIGGMRFSVASFNGCSTHG